MTPLDALQTRPTAELIQMANDMSLPLEVRTLILNVAMDRALEE